MWDGMNEFMGPVAAPSQALFSIISSLDFRPLTIISAVLDSSYLFALLLVAIVVAVALKAKDKKIGWRQAKFALVCMLLAFVIGYALKEITKVERPCASAQAKIPCRQDYSLPSLHAATAFALSLAYLGDRRHKRLFFILLAFAIFVSFSRVYLGMHSTIDVVAGFGIAGLAYAGALWLEGRGKRK
ncbi:phosphatase PAP2 family protein [Candidatus Parvarchaeota archaeon]|nr:phosphatase PAP2 family protein [Candidatus Parvarchaeota archaeon]